MQDEMQEGNEPTNEMLRQLGSVQIFLLGTERTTC